MADTGDDRQDGGWDALWAVLGGLAGFILMMKYAEAAGVLNTGPAPAKETIIGLALLLAPAAVFGAAGGRIRDEVAKERTTWATYWTTTVTVFVAVFALLGITTIDDLTEMLDRWGE
ncbi:hypothetical protein ACFVU3_28935 [Streptomyces sp. NPDC058052]|uniref:hypothetical protein n=1 Tax=Streptomyces sp. NPDC058052 TaxID=3346316 RepID=UPI0036E4D001